MAKRQAAAESVPEKVNGTESKELSATDILQTNELSIEKGTIVRVEVPEWGGHVHVKLLSGMERESYLESVRKLVGTGRNREYHFVLKGASAKLAAHAICDKNGKRLFRDEDIDALGKKSHKALKRVVDAAALINGLNDESDEESKNDSAGQQEKTADSSTGSQAS